MKVPHKISNNYWASDLHQVDIKVTSAGERSLYWAVLRVYSPRFEVWSESHLSNVPFRTRSAAKRFINIFVQGFNLRHNMSNYLQQSGWPEYMEASEPLC